MNNVNLRKDQEVRVFQVRTEELVLASVNINFSNVLCLALVRVINPSFSQALNSLTNFEKYLIFSACSVTEES